MRIKPYASTNPETGNPRIIDQNGNILSAPVGYGGFAIYGEFFCVSEYYKGILPVGKLFMVTVVEEEKK